MPVPYELQLYLSKNGVVTTEKANATGVSNERLRLLADSGELMRVSYGVYALPGELVDKMYAAQLRRSKIIYSHETALFLHDLTDRDPAGYSVTVPAGYSTTRLRSEGFAVFFVKRELHELGAVKVLTVFGNKVTAYNPERTICDCLRNRNQMDIAVVTDAVKRYAARKDKNINMLMHYAQVFRVEKPLRSYLEVLL